MADKWNNGGASNSSYEGFTQSNHQSPEMSQQSSNSTAPANNQYGTGMVNVGSSSFASIVTGAERSSSPIPGVPATPSSEYNFQSIEPSEQVCFYFRFEFINV